jgi:hypothetical protein
MSQDFFLQVFSQIIFPHEPVVSNFLKIHGDICKSRCTTGIKDNPVANLLTTLINDSGGIFGTGTTNAVDTGGK